MCGGGEVVNVDDIQLEMQMMEDQLKELFNFKILLLGAGESGKSTIVKQLKLVHKMKYSAAELRNAGNSLHMNVIDCLRALLLAVQKYGGVLSESELKTKEFVEEFEEGTRLPPAMFRPVNDLYHCETVQYAYSKRSEYWLLDSCEYYFKHLERFCDKDFVPTEEDVVMARVRTTGIVATNLEQKIAQTVPGEPAALHFQVVDVGGQRNERKKWMHCFDDVKCVLFLVNLAGYNQMLFEDNTKNRMHESMELFNTIVNKDLFSKVPIFLFLNKKDLFESMILEVDMNVTFPEYTGGKNLQNALNFIEASFQKQMPAGRQAYVQTITGTWKRDVKCAFEEVKKTLYDMNRKDLLEKAMEIHRQLKICETKAAKTGGCCAPKPQDKQPLNKK